MSIFLPVGGAVSLGSRLRKLAGILREPLYRRALLRGVAASIEHESIPLRNDFATVIDVGANRGQFALFAARRFPKATLICFEPLDGARTRLERVVDSSAGLQVFDVAVGAMNEAAEFHLAQADDSSSLLVTNQRQRDAFPGAESRKTLTVQVRRLDEILIGAALATPVLLKIDVQGGELDVLRGADSLLDSIHAILVEASFVELYAGQALVDDLWLFLRSRGFSCRGVWSMTYGVRGECLLGDLLFSREGFDPLTA